MNKAIISNEERKAFWLETIGTDSVEVESIIPTLVNLPGLGPKPVVILKIDSLSEQQFDRLAEALAEKFKTELEFTRGVIKREGVPILFEDIMLASDQIHMYMGDLDYEEEEDFYYDEIDRSMDECGKTREGICMLAGTEFCDFECPFSN